MRVNRFVPTMLSAAALSGLILTTGCGKDSDLPNDVSSVISSSLNASTTTSASSSGDDEIKAAIPKILQGLEDIKQEIQGLQVTTIASGSSGSSTSGSTSKPTTTTAKPTTTTSKPTTTTKPATTPSKPATPAAPSAADEFAKLLQNHSSKPFIQASVEKTEKSFKDGHVSQVKLTMYAKAPSTVKIDVLSSSSGAAGAKVIYTSGDTGKAKVRPGGSLSFITTELPKTDDRLLSTNGWTFDDIDLFGVIKRWSSGYSAELVGKTQLDGKDLYILKLKAKGTNALDARIDYEYVGYEPDTYKMRTWEIYTQGVKEPFFRLSLTKIDFPASLPDSTFKL